MALSLLLFFCVHHVTCGRASTLGQPVRTPCRQIRAGLLLHCSAPESLFCGFLAPRHPTFVNRAARRLLLSPALGPRFAPKRPAESAKKLIGPDASFPCALCGRSKRHSQRTDFSALWPCVLDTCDDVTYSCSQHVCMERMLLPLLISRSVL